MYRSILVPLDGSSMAESALPAAISIARRQSAQIALVTIERYLHTAPDLASSDKAEAWRSERVDDPPRYLSDVVRRVREVSPVTVTKDVRSGIDGIGQQVVQYAHDADCDLIVMATHGYGPFKRFWLGSVADSVVRRSALATLLVRPVVDGNVNLLSEPKYRHILIPLDGSKAAETIVDHALAVGGTEARYTLFHARYLVPVLSPDYAMVAATVDEEVRQAERQAVQENLDTVAERMRLRAPEIRVRTAVAAGDFVAGSILEHAAENQIDLIAMTTHGRGGAARLLLGSVADKVVRGAEVPVLLYRPA